MTQPSSSPVATASPAGAYDVPAQRPAPTACRSCGTAAPPGRTRIEGVTSLGPHGVSWDCASCTRNHLPAIEAGFPLH